MTREYPERPIVGVGVVVLRGDHVLLIERAKPPKPKEWSLPGGAQHVGETLKEAALREVLEETGLNVDLGGLIDVVDFIEPGAQTANGPRFHYSLVDYWATCSSGDACAGDDASSVKWVPLREIDALGLWDETKRIITLASQLRDEAAL